MHNDMIAYLSAMNDTPDVLSTTADNFKGRIYKCQDGTIAQAGFKCLPTFSYWVVNGDPISLYRKLLQAMKNVEEKYEPDIN